MTTPWPCPRPGHRPHLEHTTRPILDRINKDGAGWSSSPRPTNFDLDSVLSSPDECMVTPPSNIGSPVSQAEGGSQKRKADTICGTGSSASPDLKKGRSIRSDMQRTPQTVLTQSKLTGFAITQRTPAATPTGNQSPAASLGQGQARIAPDAPPPTAPPAATPMDTAPAPPTQSVGQLPPMTTEFFLRSLRENSEHVIKSFNASLGALSQKVDGNSSRISDNSAAIASQGTEMADHRR